MDEEIGDHMQWIFLCPDDMMYFLAHGRESWTHEMRNSLGIIADTGMDAT